MPNWCWSNVTFSHEDKTKVDEMVAVLEKGEEFFNHYIPLPKDKENDWYNWHIENWGTKWEASVDDFDRNDDNNLHVFLETAWSPPIAFFDKLYEDGWSIDAYYDEEGQQFWGRWNDGDEDYAEIDFEFDDWREAVSEDLMEQFDLEERYKEWKEWNSDN